MSRATIRVAAQRARLTMYCTEVMRASRPTPFNAEGPLRHHLRSNMCLEGSRWADADRTAALAIEIALDRLGATRPTWEEGQPLHAERPQLDDVPAIVCAGCGAEFIPDERDAGRRKYCSRRCSDARVRPKRLAAQPCAHCGTMFQPNEGGRQFCSRACRYAAQRRDLDRQCPVCASIYRAPFISSPVRTCSRRCAALLRYRGAPAPPADPPAATQAAQNVSGTR